MRQSFISVTILLILITDPLGNIPLFIASLKHVSPERRVQVILRECAIAFLVLVGFLFFGSAFLSALDLSDQTLRISGGVILFLIALNMIFPGTGGRLVEEEQGGEPFIVPVAIPLIAGPSAITTVMLLSKSDPSRNLEWVGAIAIAIAVTTVSFLLSVRLKDILGPRGLSAIERLMGLVLTAIAVEMLLGGISAYVAHLS
ncbi:MAG: MarC family protein [Rectinemataceae bacterium]|nr:NAAT family transporter [Spirochaetaceae bacterium]